MEDTLRDDSLERFCARHFDHPKMKLLDNLALLRSYQIVLQAKMNMAKVLGIPLESDQKSEKLGELFSRKKPRILDLKQAGSSPIDWADVICSFPYDPKLQSDGSYHVQIDTPQVVVELSKKDHDFIATGLPLQLIDPQSYPCDVASEHRAVNSVKDEIFRWKEIILQLSETVDSVLDGLSEKLGSLQDRHRALDPSDAESRATTEVHSSPLPNEAGAISPAGNRKKRKGTGGHRWTPEEIEYLCTWIKKNSHLSQTEIEDQYEFEGKGRRWTGIQAKLYENDLRSMCHKKRKVSLEQRSAAKPLTTPLVSSNHQPPSASAAPVDDAQLALAIDIIRASYDDPVSPSPISDKPANSLPPSAETGMRPPSPVHESWPTPESVGRPPDLQKECSPPNENSVRIQDRHSDQVSETTHGAVDNSKEDNSSNEASGTCHQPSEVLKEACAKAVEDTSSAEEPHEALGQSSEESDVCTRSLPPANGVSIENTLPSFATLIECADSIHEAGPGATTNSTPTPLKAVQPCHTGHKGPENGCEANESPRQQAMETDQAKKFSNKDLDFSSNLSPMIPRHPPDSVGSVQSSATARMPEQVPDVGTAALQTMQVLEPPIGRLVAPVTHTTASIARQPTCEPRTNSLASTPARPFGNFFKSAPSDREAQPQAYRCETCDKRYPQEWMLEDHRNLHTGRRPYECSRCRERFSNRTNRTRHEGKCRPCVD